jgi:uncharacterized Zn finger protein
MPAHKEVPPGMGEPQFKCPHCGHVAFRVLKQLDTVECLGCGRSHPFKTANDKANGHSRPVSGRAEGQHGQ